MTSQDTQPFSLVLAAGEGTRMRSKTPKVLHAIAGQSLISHVLTTIDETFGATAPRTVVIGPNREDVAQDVATTSPTARSVTQTERKGTAHAVLMAEDHLKHHHDKPLLILYGDTPLLQAETLRAMVNKITAGAAICVLGFEAENPYGYGRILTNDSGEVLAIREEKDATDAEKAVTFSNAGVMAFDGKTAIDILKRIDCNNAKGEYYLTDAVEIARAQNLSVVPHRAEEAETLGANTRLELSHLEALMQQHLRERHMANGVTMRDPNSVFLCRDTVLESDVILEPNIVFGRNVTVKTGATIKAFSHIEGATIGEGASVGPFARLRPGTQLEDTVKVGNFVEIKNASLATGAKASHLSYIGDAEVGAGANIGAGTITCNYDGYAKAKTTIKAGAFIGSNTALIAPVTVGEAAIIGAGSAISDDVAAGDLSFTRAKQIHKKDWAAAFHKEQNIKKNKG